jgi:DNA invertase Pin-like site-specific DNA recombinase
MAYVYGYCRVSTQRQADKGDSLEGQEASIRRVFELDYKDKGYALAAIVRDAAESGGKPLLSRPGGARLSAMLEKGDVVLFPTLDRGFRNTLDKLKTVALWKQIGASVRMLDIHVDTSTPIGEMVLTVMAAVAQFERQRISERIKSTFAHRRQQRANGDSSAVCSSRPPYGFKVQNIGGKKRFVRDDDQRELGAAIVRWREELKMTFRAIWLHMLKHRIYRYDTKGRAIPWNRVASIYEMYIREKRLQAKEKLQAEKKSDNSDSSTAKGTT